VYEFILNKIKHVKDWSNHLPQTTYVGRPEWSGSLWEKNCSTSRGHMLFSAGAQKFEDVILV